MNKIRKIDLDLNENNKSIKNVVVRYYGNKKRNFDINNQELQNIINERLTEIENKIPELEEKNKDFFKWYKNLIISGGFFAVAVIIGFFLLLYVETLPIWFLVTAVPSVVSLFNFIKNYDKKSLDELKKFFDDKQNIELINKELETIKSKVKNIEKNYDYSKKRINISSYAKDKMKKNRFKLISENLKFKFRKFIEYKKEVEKTVPKKYVPMESKVEKTLEQAKKNEEIRRQYYESMRKIDEYINRGDKGAHR